MPTVKCKRVYDPVEAADEELVAVVGDVAGEVGVVAVGLAQDQHLGARLAGLRGTDAFVASEPPAEDAPSFFGSTYIDAEGHRWQELNLQALSQNNAFLSISA